MDVKEAGYSWLRKGLTRLSSTYIADMQTDAPTYHALLTCPRGKKMIVDHIVVHSNSATLLGMDDVNFGGGADAASPAVIDAATLVSMTSAGMNMNLSADAAAIMIDGDDSTVANRTLNMGIVSGSTGAATAYVDVFGYLISS